MSYKYSIEQLLKLKTHLVENAEKLANENKIRLNPRYPGRDELRGLQEVICLVEGLGEVVIYITGETFQVMIGGVNVEADIVEQCEMREVANILREMHDRRKAEKQKNWFDNKK